jgi:8-oxo-dGTP diphosphatase
MELSVGVKAFLRNGQGRILLLKRNPEKYTDIKNLWDIVGGRINPGTPLIVNLRREIIEETGLELGDEPKLLAAQDIIRSQERHTVRLTYAASIDGEPKLNPEEHVEFGWFTLDEMRSMEGLDMYALEIIEKNIINEKILERY